MIKNKGCRWLLLFFLFTVFAFPAVATGKTPDPKLVLVNMTRVDFADFNTADYPYLQRLLTQGQVGLAVVRGRAFYSGKGLSGFEPGTFWWSGEPGADAWDDRL